jgi:hypothetical protein
MPRIVFALLCLLAPLPLAAKSAFGVKATPAWVRRVEVAAEAGAQGAGGAAFLLYDSQYRVTAGRTERYYRRVRRVASAAELESAANIELGFEPSYQELVIHHIRVVRDGRAIDALRPREIRVVQKEEELSSRLYNGELTALAFLDDVRVGDVIDYAYSVNGDNPVLGGRFAEVFYLSEFQSVARLRHRLLWPAGRALYFRADGIELQPSRQNIGAETEYVWERRDVPKLVTESQLPTWHNPYPQVQLSDFADWGDVARWAVPLYAGQPRLSPALAEQIARWKATYAPTVAQSGASPVNEAAILAALRFVQDDVRYLGIELGPYSHQPTAPPVVFERRFGDCKDKSLLLATILGEFGVEASPALVNVDRGRALRRSQPSPFAFDHVIVKAVIGGKVYWFDPTISHQRGSLSRRYNPPYGFALVIKGGSTELEEIPPPDAGAAAEPTTIIREFYRASSYAAPVLLEVVTTYLGPDADDVRADYAGRPRQEIAEDLIDSYAETEPGVEAEDLPQIEDDEEANRIVVTEKYRIADFWRDKERRVYAGHLRQTLSRLRPTSRRRAPLALTYPLGVSQTIELEMPEPVLARRDGGRVTGDAVSFDYRYAREGRTVRLEYKFHTLADGVAPERLAAHLDALDRIEHALGYSLTRGAPRLRAGDAALVLGGVAVLLVVFAVPVAVIAVIIVRKRRRERHEQQSAAAAAQPQPAPPAPGSTPEAAIDLGQTAELERYVSGLRCECGNLLRQPGEPLKSEGLIFDGRRLLNVALKCVRCGAQRDLYFVRPDERGRAPLGDAGYSES